MKQERPLAFFSLLAVLALLSGLAVGIPVVVDFLRIGSVPRLPSAVLAVGFVLVACLSFACGLILDSVTRARVEIKRLAYLSLPAPEIEPFEQP